MPICILYLCLGSVVFMETEQWSFIDSMYFCVATLTTVGFGDLVPEHAEFITIVYIIFGLVIMACFMNLVVIRSLMRVKYKKLVNNISLAAKRRTTRRSVLRQTPVLTEGINLGDEFSRDFFEKF